MTDTVCKSCGAEIVWITDQGGKRIPLNKRRVRIYSYDKENKARCGYAIHTDGTPLLTYISHFVTCPNASDHSARSRNT